MDAISESSDFSRDPPIKFEKKKGDIYELRWDEDTTTPPPGCKRQLNGRGWIYQSFHGGMILAFQRIVIDGQVIEHSHTRVDISVEEEAKLVIKSFKDLQKPILQDEDAVAGILSREGPPNLHLISTDTHGSCLDALKRMSEETRFRRLEPLLSDEKEKIKSEKLRAILDLLPDDVKKEEEMQKTKEERISAMYHDVHRMLAIEKAGGDAVPNPEIYSSSKPPTKEEIRKVYDEWIKEVTGMSDEEIAEEHRRIDQMIAADDSEVPDLRESVMEDCD